MNSLRARLAVLIAISIVAVVLLATLAAIAVIGRPGPAPFIHPAANQLALLVRLVEERPELFRDGASGVLEISQAPAPGIPLERMSQDLTESMADLGDPHPVEVTVARRGGPAVASVRLSGGGWLVTRITDGPPPRGSWVALVSWMALIVLGATVVALVVAARVVAPLALLDRLVASVGPDGRLPPLPENGPVEVRSAARALNALSSRLQKAVESRMRLVAAAGHDLRTPMTRMRLRAEFLAEDERAQWLADLDELDRIADSAIRLVREEVGRVPAEELRLDLMVADIVGELRAIGRRVSIGAIEPCLCETSRQALTRALRNLVINAATHGGGAAVSVAFADGRAVVTIDDDGPGIPEELLERVFEPFFRVDPARRQAIPGAGLGLAIAKEIVDRLGGTLTLENRPQGGFRQRVTLPARPVAEN